MIKPVTCDLFDVSGWALVNFLSLFTVEDREEGEGSSRETIVHRTAYRHGILPSLSEGVVSNSP